MRLLPKILIVLLLAALPVGSASAAPPYPLKAYEPADMLRYGLDGPEDIFVERESGLIFVADTGNRRIAVCKDGKVEFSFGQDVLQSPTGVYSDSGRIYVADPKLAKVLVFDRSGSLLLAIGRPDTPVFGKSTGYNPRKVASDARGNIYAVSDGSPNGVMQFSGTGEFVGFTGSNITQISMITALQRLIYTGEQRAQVFSALPPSPTNLTVDSNGLLYTVTAGVADDGVKKFNSAGDILMTPSFPWNTMADVAVDASGNLFAMESNGLIDVADPQGNGLFSFGSLDPYYETLGTLRAPVAVDMDEQGNIYVLDREQNAIVVYRPTEFALKVLAAVKLYTEGLYVQGDAQWRELLGIISSFRLAYSALAYSDFKQGNYAKALDEFRLGWNQGGYSDAFWQIRNTWLQNNLSALLLAIMAFAFLLWAGRRLERKYGFLRPVRDVAHTIGILRPVRELLFAFTYIRHPIDSVYEMKHNAAASVGSATALYILFLTVQIAARFGTGFVFSDLALQQEGLSMMLFYAAAPFALGIIANYLISSINDGEGRLKDIYIGIAYCLAPYILLTPFIILASNVLTQNEAFLYDAANLVAAGWSVFLAVVTVKEVHDYTVKETVKNLLLTAFTMLMIVVVAVVIITLVTQEANFVATIFGEVLIRARS